MANDWKKRMVKPSKRTLIYSKKLNQWLNESEEDIAMLEMIYDKRQAVMKKLQETDPTLTEDEAKGLAQEMLSKPNESIKILEDNDDEPEAKEKEVNDSSRDGSS
jgi:hypothetical protein